MPHKTTNFKFNINIGQQLSENECTINLGRSIRQRLAVE
jgi:hypothetical protein